MSLNFVSQKILGTIGFIILARLLTPADFGVFAIMMVVPNLINRLTEPGFGTTIMQKSGDISEHLNSIWTIAMLRAFFVSIFVFFSAPFIANFFHAEYAIWPIRLSGIFILVYNAENIGIIHIYKRLDLKKIFFRDTAGQIAYIATAVTWAFFAPSFWALVVGNFALFSAVTISTYILHPYRPKLTLKFKNLIGLIGYTKWIYAQGVLDQIYGSLETTFTGRITGVSGAGLYSRARGLASLVPGFFSSMINQIGFLSYARVKESPKKVEDGFLKSLRVLFFVYIPMIVLMMIWAENLISVVLGEQWLPMANALKILLLVSSFASFTGIMSSLFNGIGYPDIKAKITLMQMPFLVGLLFYLAPPYGIEGVALALFLSILPGLIFSFYKILKILNMKFSAIVKTGLTPLVVSGLTVLPTIFLKPFLLSQSSFAFLFSMFLVGATYLAGIVLIGLLFKRGPYNTIKVIYQNLK